MITPLKRDDIITIKLATGEELIAKYFDQSEEYLFFLKPYHVDVTPQGLMLFPYMMTAKDGEIIRIAYRSIMMACPTAEDVSNAYLEKTTGLTLVKGV